MINLTQRVNEVELMELPRVERRFTEKRRTLMRNINVKLMRRIPSLITLPQGARRQPLLRRSKSCKQARSGEGECSLGSLTQHAALAASL